MQIGLFEDRRQENFNLQTQFTSPWLETKKLRRIAEIKRKNTEEIQRERE